MCLPLQQFGEDAVRFPMPSLGESKQLSGVQVFDSNMPGYCKSKLDHARCFQRVFHFVAAIKELHCSFPLLANSQQVDYKHCRFIHIGP